MGKYNGIFFKINGSTQEYLLVYHNNRNSYDVTWETNRHHSVPYSAKQVNKNIESNHWMTINQDPLIKELLKVIK